MWWVMSAGSFCQLIRCHTWHMQQRHSHAWMLLGGHSMHLWVQLACALGGDAHAENKHVGDPVCWAAPTLWQAISSQTVQLAIWRSMCAVLNKLRAAGDPHFGLQQVNSAIGPLSARSFAHLGAPYVSLTVWHRLVLVLKTCRAPSYRSCSRVTPQGFLVILR